MSLHDLSIRARLSILTGLGLLTMSIAIGYGLYSTHVLRADIVRLGQRNIPLTISAVEIRRDVLRNWINTLYLTQIADPVMVSSIDADMRKNSEHISEQFSHLQQAIEDPDEKDLLEQALQMRKGYTAARDRYLEMSRQDKTEEARDYLMTELRPQLDAYINSLNALNAQRAVEVDDTMERAEANVGRSRMIYLILGALGLVGSLLLARALIKSITMPLDWAVYLAGKIAKGNLTNKIQSKPEKQDEISRLLNAIAEMQAQLRETAGTMQLNAAELAQAAQEFSHSAADMAQGSRVQSETTVSMAASIEEVTHGIRQLSEHTDQARTTVNHSAELAKQNSQAILQTIVEMQQISVSVTTFADQLHNLDQQSQQISAVIDVIKGLADQTNLLALNAAIEAARAGEAGRGFAVVADEVRKLAESTKQSTQEISNTIASIQVSTAQTVQSIQGAVDRVASGVAFAGNAGNAAEELHSEAGQVSQVVSDISLALREQSAASEQIAGNVERVAQMTERNSATVEQMSGSAQRLQQLADTLDQSTRRFAI